MLRRLTAGAAFVLAALLTLAGFWTSTQAQPQTYRFEAVSADIATGPSVRVEVQLLDPDGQPVPTELIAVTSTRLDMGPDGMAAMDTPLKAGISDKNDVLAFEAEIPMAGGWALTIEAKIKGVEAPVKGVVVYKASQKKAEIVTPAAPAAGERRVVYYRNPMGLADVSPVPKKDSMGMDYIPVYEDEASAPAGTVRVSLDKVQRAGVRTTPVRKYMLIRNIRGAGTIMPDESRIAVVAPRFDGFVEHLAARTTGEVVEAGAPLVTVWIEGDTNAGEDSDDLLRMQADYLSALGRGGPDVERAAHNLSQFGVPQSFIDELARTRKPVRAVTLNAPLSGTILEKPALDGMRFETGDMLFKIADLSTVWIMAEVAEQDVGAVQVGQLAHLTLPAMPGEPLEGKVAFVYPDLDPSTRSGKARIAVPNADGRLKIGLFADVEIAAPIGDKPVLTIPVDAVIDDGRRQVAFVAKGEGLFEPRYLVLGPRGESGIEVKSGLAEGENIVVAGTFLIDAESNLRAALAAFAPHEAGE